jgi:uncharacterized membrane protein HdeD (DUF308 family)
LFVTLLISMIEEFIRYWWLPLMRGAALIAFGLLAIFVANNMSLTFTEVIFRVSLVMLFALYLGVSATLTMVTAIVVRHDSHRWMSIATGLLLAGLCMAIVAARGVRLETVIMLTVVHALVNGIGEARIAVALKHHLKESVTLGVMAGVSLVAALVLAALRNSSNLTLALGSYSLLYGMCLAYFAWHLHMQAQQVHIK